MYPIPPFTTQTVNEQLHNKYKIILEDRTVSGAYFLIEV